MTDYASYFKAYPSNDDSTFLGKLFSERAKIRLATQWLQIGSLQTIHPLPRIQLGKAKGDSTEKSVVVTLHHFPFLAFFGGKNFGKLTHLERTEEGMQAVCRHSHLLSFSFKTGAPKTTTTDFFSKSVCEQFCGIGFRKRITTFFLPGV